MARLALDDGYTLKESTSPTATDSLGNVVFGGLPVVEFEYRPALPVALAEWRAATRQARGGADEFAATAKFLCDHLCSWNVTDARGNPAPVTPETLRKVPEPILDQIVKAVATWAPKKMEQDAGNSQAQCA